MKRYYWIHVLSLSLVITGLQVFFYLVGNPFFDWMELKSLDIRFLSHGEEPLGPFATLATIDEKGLDEIGKWPWPRGKIAALIDPLVNCSVIHFAFCAALASQRTNEVEA